MFYHLKLRDDVYGCMTVSLTGRPFPTNDHKRCYIVFYLEMTVSLLYLTPVQYIKNRAVKTF